jgi:hypothetical protein
VKTTKRKKRQRKVTKRRTRSRMKMRMELDHPVNDQDKLQRGPRSAEKRTMVV